MKRLFDTLHAQRRAVLFLFAAQIALGIFLGFRLPAAILPRSRSRASR
jgi:hypothetical protein